MKKPTAKNSKPLASGDYGGLVGNIGELLETARRTSARAVNALMTATYWEIGRRIVEFEQGGEKRAEYGKEMLRQLAHDLSAIHGKGFSRQNLQNMRVFYLSFLPLKICQTASGKSGAPTAHRIAWRPPISLFPLFRGFESIQPPGPARRLDGPSTPQTRSA
jgi:hypothetical protein